MGFFANLDIGFGGTNVHVIVESFDTPSLDADTLQLDSISSKSMTAEDNTLSLLSCSPAQMKEL